LPKVRRPTVGLGKTFAKKSQPVECLIASQSVPNYGMPLSLSYKWVDTRKVSLPPN
jgi:hypothetical protein